MNKNSLKAAGAIFFLVFIVSCAAGNNSSGSQQLGIKESRESKQAGNRVPGEYIITVPEGSDVSIIKKLFSDYGLIKIKSIQKYKGKQRYLIKLKQDPGPDEMKKIAEKTDTIIHIQPNYIYKIQPR